MKEAPRKTVRRPRTGSRRAVERATLDSGLPARDMAEMLVEELGRHPTVLERWMVGRIAELSERIELGDGSETNGSAVLRTEIAEEIRALWILQLGKTRSELLTFLQDGEKRLVRGSRAYPELRPILEGKKVSRARRFHVLEALFDLENDILELVRISRGPAEAHAPRGPFVVLVLKRDDELKRLIANIGSAVAAMATIDASQQSTLEATAATALSLVYAARIGLLLRPGKPSAKSPRRARRPPS
jgi:hypothetical protein